MRALRVLALIGAVVVPGMSTPTPTSTSTSTPNTAAERSQRASIVADAPRPQRPRGTGAVVYATARRAYLDVGAADGLGQGVEVVARRGGAEAGRCTVDVVGDHHAACPSAALRPGDTLTFAATPGPADPKPLPPLLTPEELSVRARAAAEAPIARVEYRPARPPQGWGGGSSSPVSST
jgi:hypothetical protein